MVYENTFQSIIERDNRDRYKALRSRACENVNAIERCARQTRHAREIDRVQWSREIFVRAIFASRARFILYVYMCDMMTTEEDAHILFFIRADIIYEGNKRFTVTRTHILSTVCTPFFLWLRGCCGGGCAHNPWPIDRRAYICASQIPGTNAP